jgi:hypothetical protein
MEKHEQEACLHSRLPVAVKHRVCGVWRKCDAQRSDAVSNGRIFSYIHASPNPYPRTDSDANLDTNSDPDSNCDTNPNANPDPESYCYAHSRCFRLAALGIAQYESAATGIRGLDRRSRSISGSPLSANR